MTPYSSYYLSEEAGHRRMAALADRVAADASATAEGDFEFPLSSDYWRLPGSMKVMVRLRASWLRLQRRRLLDAPDIVAPAARVAFGRRVTAGGCDVSVDED